jgi:hypothetical protein
MVSFIFVPQYILQLLGGVALEWVFPPFGTLLGAYLIYDSVLHMLVL